MSELLNGSFRFFLILTLISSAAKTALETTREKNQQVRYKPVLLRISQTNNEYNVLMFFSVKNSVEVKLISRVYKKTPFGSERGRITFFFAFSIYYKEFSLFCFPFLWNKLFSLFFVCLVAVFLVEKLKSSVSQNTGHVCVYWGEKQKIITLVFLLYNALT